VFQNSPLRIKYRHWNTTVKFGFVIIHYKNTGEIILSQIFLEGGWYFATLSVPRPCGVE
jgi:hypothetical protein